MQKRMILSNWSFFKAGQGCFYGGKIWSRKSSSFTFVYDCGTKQGTAILKREIAEYKSELSGDTDKVIDLMVLSHLDADHINQVDYLLKNIKCKLAVLPYLYPIDRLYLYFKAGFDDSTDDDLFATFIQDPAGFLISRGVERVIFITGNDEIGFNNITNGVPNDPTNSQFDQSENEENDLFDLSDNLRQSDLNIFDQEKANFLGKYEGKVEFKLANGTIYAGKYWEFYLYQIEQTTSDIKAFQDYIKTHFNIQLKHGHIAGDDIKEIFKIKYQVNQLKETFKSIFKEMNSTGLTILHGPTNQSYTRITTPWEMSHHESCYTLLNGDTNIHNSFPSYIEDRLCDTKVFQVPHHGSLKNWNKSTLYNLRDSHLIINYGTKNTHGHPDPNVRNDILVKSPDWSVHDNTELSRFEYTIISYVNSSTFYPLSVPMHLQHKPVIATQNQRTVDDPEHQGTYTDVRCLTIGQVQWNDPNSFSVKVWRHGDSRWSPQSEEVPLHRSLDQAILVLSTILEERTGKLPGFHLEPIVVNESGLTGLHKYINDNRGLLEERLYELNSLLFEYFYPNT